MSFEEILRLVGHALEQKFGNDEDGHRRYWISWTFIDYVIVHSPDHKHFRIDFTIDTDKNVTLGEPQLVEMVFVPIEVAAHVVSAGATVTEEEGWVWRVKIAQLGPGNAQVTGRHPNDNALPQYLTRDFLVQLAGAVNGVRFGRRHPADQNEVHDPARVAGWFDNGAVEGDAVFADLHLLKTEEDLRQKLLAARDAGQLDLFGLSILAFVAFKVGKLDGKDYLITSKLGNLISVDMVTEPGYGGRFLLAASQGFAGYIRAGQEACSGSTSASGGAKSKGGATGAGRINQGGVMNKEFILKLIAALRNLDSGRADTFTTQLQGLQDDKLGEFQETVTAALSEATVKAAAPPPPTPEPTPEPTPAAGDGDNPAAQALVQAKAALEEAKVIRSGNLLDAKLKDSKLPVPAMDLIRAQFAGHAFEEAELDTVIKANREAFAAVAASGRIGAGDISVGRDSMEKVQAAVDGMLGVKEALEDKAVQPFTSLRACYAFVTGDTNLEMLDRGGLYRVSAAIATGDFPNLLLNSMTKKLLQDIRELGMGGLDMLVSDGGNIADYKTQDRVRMGYLSDIPIVAEAAVYTELTKPTDEKISYAVAKRGGLLTISEETIRNDDLRKITQFPSRLARASRRTVKQFISDFFITPPNFDPDSVAWFHATHSNLGSVALTSAELSAREIVLHNQAEKDSGAKLGLPLEWIMIPINLKATAYQINANDDGANPWFHRFGVNHERIIINEQLTDTNDWFYGALPVEAPFLEIGYLDGRREPQIFLANDPTQGTAFTNDQIQYKVKHVFGGDIVDFRGVGKNVVV